MNTLHYRPHFIRDWAASSTIKRMDLAKRGAYHELLDAQWQDGHIPHSPSECAEILGLTKTQWVSLGFPLDKCFPVCEDGLRRNARCDEERERAMVIIERNRKNGAKGGRPSFAKSRNSQVQNKPSGLIWETQTEPNSNRIPESEIEIYTISKDIGQAEAKPTPKEDKSLELAGEMIDYLNKVCNRNFTVGSGGAKSLRARCKTAKTDVALMAMRVACKYIVDYKFAEWGADPNMRQYLRPETLFSNEHWESYLHAAMDWDSRGRPTIRKHMNGKMPVETMTQRAARIVAEIEAEGGL